MDIGDTLRLKIGYPDMTIGDTYTVIEIYHNPYLTCTQAVVYNNFKSYTYFDIIDGSEFSVDKFFDRISEVRNKKLKTIL